tara:strand:- start:36 stop:347 length:312 start_codon:yes stop_codon:yes gene_type:complete
MGQIRTSTDVRTKTAAEIIIQNIDFVNLGLGTGETVSTVVSTTVSPSGGGSDVLVDSTAVSGTKAQLTLSGGVAGTTYKVEAKVTTSGGQTLEGAGIIYVGTT